MSGGLLPAPGEFVSVFGVKKTGKSSYNRLIFHRWSGDKLCIDVNGDEDPGPGAIRLAKPLNRWPDEPGPLTLHYVPDWTSKSAKDDLDRALGMALFPQDRPVLLWLGEFGRLTDNARPTPYQTTLYQASRHYGPITLLMDQPRAMWVHTSALNQTDRFVIFDMPNRDDQDRLADHIGIERVPFRAALRSIHSRGPYWHAVHDRANPDHAGPPRRLEAMPPLPLG